MPHPLSIWVFVFGSLFVWCGGILATLPAASRRAREHHPAWLLVATMWPMVWPMWLWVLWRERAERRWYEALEPRHDISAEPLQLVPAGTPYGSPLPARSALAPEILAAPYR